jgi:endonuclease/exonuclease/phosphatase family metal-dependent hydrolase
MSFNLISTNIRFDNPDDGIHVWDNRKHILWKLCMEFSPQILCSQEGREPQLRDFAKLNGMQIVDTNRTWISERMYPTIYVDPKEIIVHRSGDIWLSETPSIVASKSFNSMFPRLFTWIEATTLVSGKNFFLANVHLDHLSEETRVAQVKVLIQEIEQLNDNDYPIILCGDFNSAPTDTVRKEIMNSALELQDPWLEHHKGEETSFHKFTGDYIEGSRIDWVLISKTIYSPFIDLERRHKDKIFPSDHYPVLCEIDLG